MRDAATDPPHPLVIGDPHEATARTADGTLLRTLGWSPQGDPWARVLIVHGLGEHAGRYTAVGSAFAGAGLEVHAYDQRGFGRSAGRRAYVERWSVLHDDLEARLAAVRGTRPDLPLVLYGHSMGGLVATGYVLADPRPPLPDRLVLSAPALDSAIPQWRRTLAAALGVVLPHLAMGNGLAAGGLSRDPAVERRYRDDPLVVTRSTARFGASGFAEQQRIAGLLRRGVQLPIPTYVFHGSEDPIVPPTASELLIGHGDVTRRVFSGLRHECHHEPESDEVLGAVVGWIRGSLAPSLATAAV